MKKIEDIKEFEDIDTYYEISKIVEEVFQDRVEVHKHLVTANKEIERLNEKIDTLKIEISSLMSRYFYEEDFYIEDTHLDKLLRIIDNDIVLRGSDKE